MRSSVVTRCALVAGLAAAVTTSCAATGSSPSGPPSATTDAVTAQAQAATPAYGIWPGTKPSGGKVMVLKHGRTIGTRFTAGRAGTVTSIRFYRAADAPVRGLLYTAAGRLLARTTFAATARHGWLSAKLSKAVSLKAGALYVVAATVPKGRYLIQQNRFAHGRTVKDGVLTASRGRWAYGYRYPWRTSLSAYFVDVAFRPAPPPPPPHTAYPARWSVGAPGVKPYAQSTKSLPVPPGYTQVEPSSADTKEYDLYECDKTINLDHKYFHAYLYIGTGCHGTINITNSIIAPPAGSANRAILVNSDSTGSLTLNIRNSTIRPEPVPLGGTNGALNDHAMNDCDTCTIHLSHVDVANTGGMCLCGHNTVIEYSWLHDNYIANLPDPTLAHTGGVFPYGGEGPLHITHCRLEPGVNAATGKPVDGYWKAITAVLFTQNQDGSTLRNYVVDNSFISLGAYGMDLEDGVGLTVVDNVFGPTHWGRVVAKDNVTFTAWSGNVVGDINGRPTTTPVPRP